MTVESDRLAGHAKRAPLVIAFLTIAALVVMWDGSRDAFGAGGAEPWLDWVVIGFLAYGVVASMYVVPRYIAPRAAARGFEHLTLLRWAFAMAPFLIGFGAWAIGADEWAATVALIGSALLLIAAATHVSTDQAAP
jgi:hypothetical protein